MTLEIYKCPECDKESYANSNGRFVCFDCGYKPITCKHCEFLHELFRKTEDMTDREYYLITEIFCYLHDNKDECNISKALS